MFIEGVRPRSDAVCRNIENPPDLATGVVTVCPGDVGTGAGVEGSGGEIETVSGWGVQFGLLDDDDEVASPESLVVASVFTDSPGGSNRLERFGDTSTESATTAGFGDSAVARAAVRRPKAPRSKSTAW